MPGPNKPNGDNRDNNKKSPLGFLGIILWALLFVVLFNMCATSMSSANDVEVGYGTFRKWVAAGYVSTVDMQTNYYFTLKADAPMEEIIADIRAEQEAQSAGETDTAGVTGLPQLFTGSDSVISVLEKAKPQEISFVTAPVADDQLVELLDSQGVYYSPPLYNESSYLFNMLLSYVLPMVIMVVAMIFVYRFIFKKMGSGIGGLGGVGKANAKVYVEKKTGVTFRDVAGQDEAKESLEEIIDILHNTTKYTEIGAKLPKGALLVGPPGTGKTLLAKAVAGEANVPFFSISGSDFVEMFVGVGASRVRDLFQEAAKMAPCIIFIDEIDTIGKSRDNRMGGNDEREQTLNQLLAELDGFDPTKGVIVLAATNRPEVLDQALLRPGRFDRRITVDRPNLAGRLATLQVHTRNIRLSEDVDLNRIAQATAGCVGADLANLVNEAALRAVRLGRKAVNQNDLLVSFELVIAGAEKKGTVLTEQEKRLVAYHEVGHALVAAMQKDTEPVQKITIVPHTQGALGFTLQTPEEEKFLNTREEILAKIKVCMGGRAAEELILHTQTTGAAQDIQQATGLAQYMVTMYGMSEEFGMVGLASRRNQFLEGGYGLNCAQDTAAEVDRLVTKIIKECYQEALNLLRENETMLHAIAGYLLEKETITGGEMRAILEGRDPATADDFGASGKSPALSGDIEPPARNIHMISQVIEPPAPADSAGEESGSEEEDEAPGEETAPDQEGKDHLTPPPKWDH